MGRSWDNTEFATYCYYCTYFYCPNVPAVPGFNSRREKHAQTMCADGRESVLSIWTARCLLVPPLLMGQQGQWDIKRNALPSSLLCIRFCPTGVPLSQIRAGLAGLNHDKRSKTAKSCVDWTCNSGPIGNDFVINIGRRNAFETRGIVRVIAAGNQCKRE